MKLTNLSLVFLLYCDIVWLKRKTNIAVFDELDVENSCVTSAIMQLWQGLLITNSGRDKSAVR